jgi:hypothetical protein
MGGGLALVLGNLLSQHTFSDAHTQYSADNYDKVAGIAKVFRGCVLLAPMVNVNRPPAIVCSLMDMVMTPLFGTYSLPDMLCGATNYAHSVSNESYHNYIILDRHDSEKNPTGLMWAHNVRYATATTCLALSDRVLSIIPQISFPFVVLHDPEDKITTASGSLFLFENSPDNPMKEYIKVKDGLHDLLTNKLGYTVSQMLRWMERHDL